MHLHQFRHQLTPNHGVCHSPFQERNHMSEEKQQRSHGKTCCHHQHGHHESISHSCGCKTESHHGQSHGRNELGHGNGRGQHRGEKRQLKRLFERGDLPLLLLLALQKKPAHGYELIKSINHISNGLYEPSPGVVYPTLSMLEEQELILQDNNQLGKKVFNITEKGLTHLQEHQERLITIQKRLTDTQQLQQHEQHHLSVEIDEAIRQFKVILRHQLRVDALSVEQIEAVAHIIRQATIDINKINESLNER